MDEKYARHGGDVMLKFDDIINTLKNIYTDAGGEASAVANIATVSGMLDKVDEIVKSGGGGTEYPVFTAEWHEDTETYTYSCSMTYNEVLALLTGVYTLAGIYIDTDNGGSTSGGTWYIDNVDHLVFVEGSGLEYWYHDDGTITKIE